MHNDLVRVWDPLVRIFHWGLIAAFATAYVTQEQEYDLHLLAGYSVLGLVSFRILWGFIGPRYARFGTFVRGPGHLLSYVSALARGRAPRFAGHNPAGGVMILLLLLVMLVITLSGIALDGAENRAGPLGGTNLFLYGGSIKAVHDTASDLAMLLILAHVLGVAHASFVHRENLVWAMITGRKRCEPEN